MEENLETDLGHSWSGAIASVMVNFISQRDWNPGYQVAGKAFFLDMSERVFLGDIGVFNQCTEEDLSSVLGGTIQSVEV